MATIPTADLVGTQFFQESSQTGSQADVSSTSAVSVCLHLSELVNGSKHGEQQSSLGLTPTLSWGPRHISVAF